jgi:hypothetical protein
MDSFSRYTKWSESGIMAAALRTVIFCLLFISCSKPEHAKPSLPGNGANIQGVYFIQQYGYTTSYFSAYLLLKDGSIKKNLVTPPESIDEQQSKQQNPDDWGKWTMSGDAIKATWKDGTTESWDTWYFGMPADKGEKLKGKYTSQFAVENKQYEAFDFTTDGKFSLTLKKAGTDQTLTGSYLLDGYGITLKFDDGHTEQWAFNFYCIGHNTPTPQKNVKAFIMAEDNYTSG